MTFSIVTVYWGNNENLKNFIDDCFKYSDDVVVAYIDLFDDNFKSDKATIINLPYNYLLNYGYARAYNVARNFAKNKWVYALGVGERITQMNEDILSSINSSRYCAYPVMSEELPGTWIRFSNIEKTSMCGKIHEEPVPMKILGKVYPIASDYVVSVWKKVPYIHRNKFEENVVNGYRLLSRAKWLAGFSNIENRLGPADYWWNFYDNSLAESLFKETEYIYQMPKNQMVIELSKRSDWREYHV